MAYISKGDYDSAISACNRAIQIDPNYADAHINLGDAYKGKGDSAKAVEAYFNVGDLCERNRDYNGAIEAYGKVVEILPDFGRAHQKLGDVHKLRGDYDAAIEAYNKAIQSASYRAENVYIDLGVAYRLKGDYDNAFETFSKAAQTVRDYKNPYYRGANGRVICALCDKVPFLDEAAANRVVNDAIARGDYLRAYAEESCGHWHTTSDPLRRYS